MPLDTSKCALTPSAADSAVHDLGSQLRPIFDAALAAQPHVVLAVSGGPDSMALLHLVSDWRRQRLATTSAATPTLSVVTIDHGLRAESAAEAEVVAVAAAHLDLPHATLRWYGAKPKQGIQAAARNARYRLIAWHLAEQRWPAVATAHTADDQAETLLMRLARGSGVDGLAAMRPATRLGDGALLLRPLLTVAKAALVAFLKDRGVGWCDDPSNQSRDFERIRVRQALSRLRTSEFPLDHMALARSAARAARASDALNRYADLVWTKSGGRARLEPLGYAVVDWSWLLAQPEDIRLRLLTRLVDAIGGQDEPVSQAGLERLTVARAWNGPPAATLHGTQWDNERAGQLRIAREAGRPLPETATRKDQPVLWDRRFTIQQAIACEPARIAALGPGGLAALDAAGLRRPDAPVRALWTLPAVYRETALIAVPALNFARPGFAEAFICEPVVPQFGTPRPDDADPRNDGQ